MANAQKSKSYVMKNTPLGHVAAFSSTSHPSDFNQHGDLFYVEVSDATRKTNAKIPSAAKVTDFMIDKFTKK